MPTPIIKRDAVVFEEANLEEFVSKAAPIIPSRQVLPVDNEETDVSPKTPRPIIRGSDVRVQLENIDIELYNAEATPEPLVEIPVDEVQEPEQSLFDEEQLEAFKQEIDAEWQTRLQEAVENAKKEAFEEGFNSAKGALEKETELSKKEFEKGLDRFKESWENYLKRSETILMQIALKITQFIIDVPLPKKFSDITENVLNEALDQLSQDTPLTLSLNPLDLLRLQESGMMGVISEKFPALRWDPQPNLKEGNWIIQTPKQAIRRISDELLYHLKDQFGIAEHGQSDVEVNSTLPGYEIEYIPPVTNVAVSTTSVPLNEPALPSSLSQQQTVSPQAGQQPKNAAFSPATSTAIGASGEFPDVSNFSESES